MENSEPREENPCFEFHEKAPVWVKSGSEPVLGTVLTQTAGRFIWVSLIAYSIKTVVYTDIMTPYPHPRGVRLWSHGFSHGLKSVHRTLFAPVCALVPAFRIPQPIQKRKPTLWVDFHIWSECNYRVSENPVISTFFTVVNMRYLSVKSNNRKDRLVFLRILSLHR